MDLLRNTEEGFGSKIANIWSCCIPINLFWIRNTDLRGGGGFGAGFMNGVHQRSLLDFFVHLGIGFTFTVNVPVLINRYRYIFKL